MSGYKGGKEIKKKIDRFLQKKYHSKERKPSMSAKAIVYDVFEKIIISLTPS
jgi:hypothetical protein